MERRDMAFALIEATVFGVELRARSG